jgi:hypothetical protein
MAENTVIVAREESVIITDEMTLEEYLIVGLLQIILMFSSS